MNNKTRLGLSDALHVGLPEYIKKYGSLPQYYFQVLNAIMACRTETAGGHRKRCSHCPHTEIAYNSCRNRHCPRCQGYKAKQWSNARTKELLPIPYFHLVFTVPHELNTMALQNAQVFYTILFQAVSQTLLQLGNDPKWLGGQVGFFSVLHTWTQTLMDHFHIHIVIPSGGLIKDGTAFKRTRPDFIFPVNVMSALFRGKLLAFLKEAIVTKKIQLHGELKELLDPAKQRIFFNKLYKKNFVVFAKKPFAGPAQVVQYLSLYTHRVAITDYRIVKVSNKMITFRYKDRDDNNKVKTKCLEAAEFIRRFLMHILPHGFVKIRYFGFMAHAVRKKALLQCLLLLKVKFSEELKRVQKTFEKVYVRVCPICKKGVMSFDCVLPVISPG